MRPHHRFWPARLPHKIDLPETSLWENLAISARRFPNITAIQFLGQSITYGELMRQSERLAAWLFMHGVNKGDRVILLMQNCPQWIVAHFAILRANAVVVPVNPINRAKELEHYITDPDVKLAITTADLAHELKEASEALPEGQGLNHLLVTQWPDMLSATDDEKKIGRRVGTIGS